MRHEYCQFCCSAVLHPCADECLERGAHCTHLNPGLALEVGDDHAIVQLGQAVLDVSRQVIQGAEDNEADTSLARTECQ
jgi:hypothetical protein